MFYHCCRCLVSLTDERVKQLMKQAKRKPNTVAICVDCETAYRIKK